MIFPHKQKVILQMKKGIFYSNLKRNKKIIKTQSKSESTKALQAKGPINPKTQKRAILYLKLIFIRTILITFSKTRAIICIKLTKKQAAFS